MFWMIKTWKPVETSQLDPFEPHQPRASSVWLLGLPSSRLRIRFLSSQASLRKESPQCEDKAPFVAPYGWWLLSLLVVAKIVVGHFSHDLGFEPSKRWFLLVEFVQQHCYWWLKAKIMSSSWVFIARHDSLDSRVDAVVLHHPSLWNQEAIIARCQPAVHDWCLFHTTDFISSIGYLSKWVCLGILIRLLLM